MIPEFSGRKDELKDWLTGELKGFLYDQLSPSYCMRSGLDFLKDVPLPFTPTNYVKFQDGEELPVSEIADNIVLSLGADTHFKYAAPYKRFLARFFDEKLVDVVLSRSHGQLGSKNYRRSPSIRSRQSFPEYTYCTRSSRRRPVPKELPDRPSFDIIEASSTRKRVCS